LEAWASLILGGAGAFLAWKYAPLDQRIAAAGDYQALSGALAGIVFAGFALVVGLMTDRYVLQLSKTNEGVPGFLSPFLVGTGIQIFSLLLAVTYRAAAKSLQGVWEPLTFGLSTIVFLYAALDVISLARTVYAHAVTKADLAEIEDLQRHAASLQLRRQKPGSS